MLRAFSAQGPNRLWVAEITYVPTLAGLLSLAVVVEAWSRRVVGWAMAPTYAPYSFWTPSRWPSTNATPKALFTTPIKAANIYLPGLRNRCREAGILPSMGSVGDCYDNALCESFFATLEGELLDRVPLRSIQEGRQAVFVFLEG